ncbi:MAG: LysR family transcriptional regulator [Deltaproteobacteria bacterium]|nr:LysR family transcriptional regulator [Deltaproteobacteria bacterium]
MTPDIATLTFRDLEYIIAIDYCKSFRIAAQECAVSQPALSAQIKKIEDVFDIQIFERTNREVITTSLGKNIVKQCHIILEELEMLGSVARGSESLMNGTLRLGILETLSPYLLGRLMSQISKAYPNLKIVLRESKRDEMLEDLRVGKLEAVISTLPLPSSASNFCFLKLFFERFRIASSIKNDLSKRKAVNVSKIDPDRLILLDQEFSLTEQTCEILDHEILASATPTFTTSIEAAYMMLKGSDKHFVVPELAAQWNREIKGVSLKPLNSDHIGRTIGLIWRPRYKFSDSLREFGLTIGKAALKTYPFLRKP